MEGRDTESRDTDRSCTINTQHLPASCAGSSSCQQKWMPWIGYRPVTSTVLTFSLLSMVMAICILLPRRKATKWSISSSLRSGTRPGPGKLSERFSLTILLPWKAQAEVRTPPLALLGEWPSQTARDFGLAEQKMSWMAYKVVTPL